MSQIRLDRVEDKPYSLGAYDVVKGDEQWIRISEGCPHNCVWCREPTEFKFFGIPEIKRNNVSILDMNLLAKREAEQVLKELAEIRVNDKVVYYHALCGFDYRFLTKELAELIKKARFQRPYLAWDNHLDQQYKIKDAINMLVEVGYQRKEIGVFMICNHPLISFKECWIKLLCLATQGVQVFDCYFDNQLSPNVLPIGWSEQEIKQFRSMVRKANQITRHNGCDPEVRLTKISLTSRVNDK